MTTTYMLGVAGAEIVGGALGMSKVSWATGPKSLAINRRRHDLGVTDLFLALRDSCREFAFRQGDREIRLELSAELANYYAASHLSVAFRGGHYIDRQGRPHPSGQRNVRPDGFAALGVRWVSPAPQGQPDSFLLPLLIEHDTGTRLLDDVAAQVASYLPLAGSGAMLKRFPQLQADGFAIPLVVATGSLRHSGPAHPRIRSVKERALRAIKERGYHERPPIFFAHRSELFERGLDAHVVPLWGNITETTDGPQLLSALLQACAPLTAAGQLSADTELEIDHEAAAWTGGRQLASRDGKQGDPVARLDQYRQLAAKARAAKRARRPGRPRKSAKRARRERAAA